MRLQQSSQAEAERVQNDALQFRQQTQQQCEALISRSRQEAATIQEGANRYAEQVLTELEGRLKDMGQVVVAGRRELVRLQAVDPTTLVQQARSNEEQAVPISPAAPPNASSAQQASAKALGALELAAGRVPPAGSGAGSHRWCCWVNRHRSTPCSRTAHHRVSPARR